ncbi:MAG: hypothetical protein Q7J57_16365 [Gemmobacter sp.]|nr:hypothetical protein [Gemmobacter sp.]
MSHLGTYAFHEKTSISKEACAPDLAGSGASMRNDAGTSAKSWHKSDTAGSASGHGAKENPDALAGTVGANPKDPKITRKKKIPQAGVHRNVVVFQ